jgi:hypothetical protein
VDDDMDEGKPNRDGEGMASSNADLDSKSSLAALSNLNEMNDMPSSSAGATTMSNMPGGQQRKMKPFKLVDAIKPIEYEEMQRMSTDSFNRILQSEGKSSSKDVFIRLGCDLLDICETAGVGHVRKKTMTSLVCLSERSFRDRESISTMFFHRSLLI